MNLINLFANIILEFSHAIVMVPLIIVGFIWFSKRIFGHGVYLLLFTMIFNVVLKLFFQIPLSSDLEKVGFAFPSGHIQSATVFYGWLILKIPNLPLRLLLSLIIISISCSLIYCGYHNYLDILAGIAFASLTILFYQLCINYPFLSYPINIGIILLIISHIMLYYIKYHNLAFSPSVYQAYYSLIGWTISWGLIEIKYNRVNYDWLDKIFAILFLLVMILFVRLIFNLDYFRYAELFLVQSQWFFIALLIPSSLLIGNTLRKKFLDDKGY